MNRLILLCLAVSCGLSNASVLEKLQQNGIIYDIYGAGRLIDESLHCRPWRMDLFSYVNSLETKQMTEFGRTTLKRRLYQSFANICHSFNVPTDTTEMPAALNSSSDHLSLRFMDRFELAWNLLKFERDLKSLFLEHKLNMPFKDLVGEAELRLYSAADVMDFSQKTTIFPNRCQVAQLVLESTVCLNVSEPSMSGDIYAIAHTGQFSNDEQAFVYYDIPQYVLIEDERLVPVDIEKCKVMFGSYIFCFSPMATSCDVTNLDGCQLKAVRAGDGFTKIRPFGTGSIVATTMQVFDALGNGTLTPVPSSQFTLRVSYFSDETSQPIVEEIRMLPVEATLSSFPSILGETLSILKETPSSVYKIARKGKAYLSHKMPPPSVWDGVREFFLHLV